MASVIRWAGHLAVLVFYLLRQLVSDSFTIGIGLLRPRQRLNSRIIELPLRCRTEAEIAVFATLVGITPRQVSAAVGTDPPCLLVYGLGFDDPDAMRRQLYHLETLFLHVCGSPAACDNPPEVSAA